jgi:uncharacterized membrane protein
MKIIELLVATKKDNIIKIVELFLGKINISITSGTIKKSLCEHPYFPSILSISEAFTSWKIENTVMRLHKEHITRAPVPFIAHLNVEGGLFVVVHKIDTETVEFQDHQPGIKTIPVQQFLATGQGIVLFAEATPESGERDYKKAERDELVENIIRMLIPVTLVGLVFFGLCFRFLTGTFIPAGIITLLKFTGIVVSLLIIAQDLNIAGTALQKVCSFHKKVSCKELTTSGASKLFGTIPWSDIGFVYFTGGFLVTLTSFPSNDSIGYLAWLNLFSLPFVGYSLIYQGYVAKKWCPLCLATLLVLLLEAFSFYPGYWSHPEYLTFSPVLNLITCFGLSIFLMAYMKPVLSKISVREEAKYELTRLKRNKTVFEAISSQCPVIQLSTENIGIASGNPDGTHTLVKICNPFCGPCGKAHPQIEELLQQNTNVRVKIIFFVTSNKEDKGGQVAMYLMALYKEQAPPVFRKALHDWYHMEVKDFEKWASLYPVKSDPGLQKEEIDKMLHWCLQAKIEHTPTFFVNNRKLPEMYSIEELKYLLQ